jgi:hypothetical protein
MNPLSIRAARAQAVSSTAEAAENAERLPG